MDFFDNLRHAVVVEHQSLLQQLESQYEEYIVNLLRQKAEIHAQLQNNFYRKLAEIDQMIIHAANDIASSVHPQKAETAPNPCVSAQSNNNNNHTKQAPVVIDVVSSPSPDIPETDNKHSSSATLQRPNIKASSLSILIPRWRCDRCNKQCKTKQNYTEHIQSHSTQQLQLFIDSHRAIYDAIVLSDTSNPSTASDSNSISIQDITITPSPPPPDILLTNIQKNGISASNSESIMNASPFLAPQQPSYALSETAFNFDKENTDNTISIGSKSNSETDANQMAEVLKTEGNKLMKQHKFKEAVTQYTKAIDLDSNNAIYFSNRASAQTKLGNYTQAILDSRKASAIDPYYIKAYLREGLAYYEMAEYQKALNVYLEGTKHIQSNSELSSKFCTQIQNKIALCRLKMEEANKMRIHRDKKKRYEPQCQFCPYTATSKDEVQRHELIHYTSDTQQIYSKPSFKCRVCDEQFMQERNLKKHMTIHSTSNDHQCRQCRKPFKTKPALQKHIKNAHHISRQQTPGMRNRGGYSLPPPPPPKPRIVRAIITDRRCKAKKSVVRVEPPKPARYQYTYSPPQPCNASTSSNNSTKQQSQHNTRSDDEQYANRPLSRHKRTRSGNKHPSQFKHPKVCDVCGQICRGNRGLAEHKLSHSDARPFECDTCHRSFKLLRYLHSHIRNEHKGYPMQCKQCNETFKYALELRQHVSRMHPDAN